MSKAITLISIIVVIFLVWFFWIKPTPVANNLKKIIEIETKVDSISEEFKIYLDGLPEAEEVVRIPFEQGLKAMEESKWDEAIENFRIALKEAKQNELVALFNFIAICEYITGSHDEALKNLKESRRLTVQFKDKEGRAIILGNIGLIYHSKGDLDNALKYYVEAMMLDIEMVNQESIASQLNNIGLIYQAKGNSDKALEYLNQALEIYKGIGAKREIEKVEHNIKSIEEKLNNKVIRN